jgi:hypothetical protein
MLAVLVIKACLVAAPGTCASREVTTSWSQLACLRRGRALAARWVAEHPDWFVDRFRCEPGLPA